MRCERWRTAELNGGGHRICPDAVATGRGWSGEGLHPLSGEGLGQADAVAAGLAQVGVVQQPVDGGGSQSLGMSSSKPEGCRFDETAIERRS